MADCCDHQQLNESKKKQILLTVLLLNLGMFLFEFAWGWIASSTGLLADSLDMLADAVIYGLSLLAVSRSTRHKAAAALVNGILQCLLAVTVLVTVIFHYFSETTPDAFAMGWVATLALMVNLSCVILLYRYRQGEINLRASWLCSRNDMLANLGVIVAAVTVSWLEQGWPDLLIGSVIALVIIRSATGIIRESVMQLRG